MNKQLPERPDLDQLKRQAKDLLDDNRAQRPEALVRVPQNELAGFVLADAQRILAREYGFPSWAKLKARVELSGPALAARAIIHASLQGQADRGRRDPARTSPAVARGHPGVRRTG